MGKSEKQRTPTSVRYPYAPVKVSSQQLLAKSKTQGADTGTYASGHPVFSSREPLANDMKHLEFLRALGQYYYGKLSTVYNSSCAFLPASCQSGLRNLEDRVGYISGPLVQSSERVLVNLDCKVDTVYQILHSTRHGNALSDKSSQAGIARIDKSVQFLREHGLAGLARQAMQKVMSRDGASETSSMDPQALRDSPHQEDTWSQYAMSPVIKVAEPGIRYTQQVYGDAHRAVVSSETYISAVEIASDVLTRLQETTIYKASANRLYPAISGVADPALEKLVNSAYAKALVDHLKPLKEHDRQPITPLICATC